MKRHNVGKLIVFEGPDGVGKTTLSKLAVELLMADGQPTEWLSFPGREVGTLGHLIYEVHHQPDKFAINSISNVAKQTLHIAAHLDVIERKIRPLLDSGKHVILDRYWWSTWVYGLSAGINRELLHSLIEVEKLGWGATRPFRILLVKAAAPRDRDNENLEQWHKLVEGYQILADEEMDTATRLVVDTFDNNISLTAAEEALKAILPLETRI
ncbi:dTMP kinase [Hymenobacter actinosclerus]|uniref:dTMP kinase n=1 Tax=Hymenobacter actinosclerus TaxID=82805 RepID=A0A1I0JA82_9BACT|nr:hypothetical protein [Hymenobacter actinosclerus]SEU06652.1 dTMP kinase [Hymenobacter actinosclerus]